MLFLILFIAGIVLGVCVLNGDKKSGFIGAIAALLTIPLGVIFSISKKYK